MSQNCNKTWCNFTLLLLKTRDEDKDNFLAALSTSFVYTVTMEVRGVHHWLYHTLSDDDTIAVLHMHNPHQ